MTFNIHEENKQERPLIPGSWDVDVAVEDDNGKVTNPTSLSFLSPSSPFDCIIFDLDNTLYPTVTGIGEALKKHIEVFLVEKCGFPRSKASGLHTNFSEHTEAPSLVYEHWAMTSLSKITTGWEENEKQRSRLCSGVCELTGTGASKNMGMPI
ncbi:uncharacterized protein LOC129300387 [Prosopis cineraria]|uniref:uncharacterized protein LOC129300387 n=1 Tax=Prosopis cineraria TaxID=364024 RepID=UPI00240EC0FC|nr:uncharacterized protein LOC129300387 [Prosopis cineraria]